MDRLNDSRNRGFHYEALENEEVETDMGKEESTDNQEKNEDFSQPWYKTITPYNVYVLIVLLVTYLLNQLDRYMLAITSKSMAQEIHFGDLACMANTSFSDDQTKGVPCNSTTKASCYEESNNQSERVCKWDYNGQGQEYQIVAGPVFILIYTFAGIFIGFVADKYNRKIMLGICLIFWSVMTLLTGFVKEYWQLVILRFGLGLGEAGCTPFAASILTDYYSAETRGLALGIYNFGIYFGYSLSYTFGNFVTLADINGQGWRWTFILAGIPGVLIGALLMVTVKEPQRQLTESDDKKTNVADLPLGAKIKRVLQKFCTPSLVLICLAGSIRNAAGYVFAYNTQIYFTSIGETKEDIAKYMSWIPLVGGSFSVLVGGFISDRLVKRLGLYSRVSVIIISLLIAAPFAAGTLYFKPPYAYLCQIPTYIFGEMWIGITLAVVVELIPSDIKTAVIATYLFIITNIGGNAQVLVPPISKAFENDGYNKADALRDALYFMYPGPYVYGAFVYLLSLLAIRRDKKKIQRKYAQK